MNYDVLAAAYAANRRVHPGIVTALQEAIADTGARTVLEVGCGTGSYAAALQGAAQVFGADAALGMLTYAQAGGLRVCQAKAEAIPLRAEVFDLVYTVDVIHHLRDPRPFFAEAHRLLREGGLLCTATDSARMIATRMPLAHYWPETVASELARYHPIPQLRAWLEEAGFRAVVEEEVEHAYLLEDAEPYRRRAYSTLQRIPDEAFARGLAQFEADLARGPIRCVSRYVLVWGKRS